MKGTSGGFKWAAGTLLEDFLIQFRAILYILFVIFFIFGIVAAFTGAAGLGIFLIVLNAVLFFLLRRLDKKAAKKEDQEFEEMVKRNRGE